MKKMNKIRGFTLIELLISVSIFAIISVVLYSSFRGGIVSWRRIDAEQTKQMELRHIFDKMTKDFKNMFYSSNIMFKGMSEKIEFTTTITLAETADVNVGVVSYYISQGDGERSSPALVRTEESLMEALVFSLEELEDTQEPDKEASLAEKDKRQKEDRLLEDIAELKFSYLVASKGSDQGQAVTYEWRDLWETEDMLPVGIKVELVVDDPDDNSQIKLSKRIRILQGEPLEGKADIQESILSPVPESGAGDFPGGPSQGQEIGDAPEGPSEVPTDGPPGF